MKYFKTEICTILGCNIFKTDGDAWWGFIGGELQWYPMKHPAEYIRDDLKHIHVRLSLPPMKPLLRPLTEAEAFIEIL